MGCACYRSDGGRDRDRDRAHAHAGRDRDGVDSCSVDTRQSRRLRGSRRTSTSTLSRSTRRRGLGSAVDCDGGDCGVAGTAANAAGRRRPSRCASRGSQSSPLRQDIPSVPSAVGRPRYWPWWWQRGLQRDHHRSVPPSELQGALVVRRIHWKVLLAWHFGSEASPAAQDCVQVG